MLQIDPEFAGKVPPLTEEEFRQLEENILEQHAVLMPLIVWNGLIVDGHNRYKIIQEHPDVTYSVHEIEFPDRFSAIAWICKNQLGRRNLTPQQKKYLIGQRYEAERQTHGGDRKSDDVKSSSTNENLIGNRKTCERIAEDNNVSHTYVSRAASYAKGIDAAEEAVPGIKEEILSGKIKPTDAAVAAIAAADPDEREEKAEKLRESSSSKTTLSAPKKKNNKKDCGDLSSGPPEEEPEKYTPVFTSKEPKARDVEIMREIGEGMATSSAAMTADDVLYELEDAVNTMIFRWNLCMEQNPSLISKKKCCTGIQKLIRDLLNYTNTVKGELSI